MLDNLIKERYCMPGEKTYEDVCIRVSNALGVTPDQKKKLLDALLNKDFILNSPAMMNAGAPGGQLSACFVLPIEDSIDGIFDSIKYAAKIHKSGGGTGFSFSNLRPNGSKVNSTDGVASGPVSFMNVFNAATEAIKQGGKRRGANLGCIRIDHPDIMEFITCKSKEGNLANFNISVMITDEFMGHVMNDKLNEIWIKHPATNKEYTVGEIWQTIVHGSWANGEPGVLFYDTINNNNPCPELGTIEATNPCGEQPLRSYESCILGSINISNFVESGVINYTKLNTTTKLAIDILNNIIDLNSYPIPQIKEATLETRKIGLGIMGLHDLFIKLGISYSSETALKIAEDIWKYIKITADSHSNGRNKATTCIAPTGSISILAGASSGIEPITSWVYTRKDSLGEHKVLHYLFEQAIDNLDWNTINDNIHTYPGLGVEIRGKDIKQYIIEECFKKGTIQHLDWLGKDFLNIFKTGLDIDWKTHIKMQSTFQKYCDAAVSKTVNMSYKSTERDIKDALLFAWKSGCKGVTLYRTGSRDLEVINLKKEIADDEYIIDEDGDNFYISITEAYIYEVKSGCGKFFSIVGHDRESPTKVFVEGDGTGGCVGNMAGLGRSISAGLEWGTPAEKYIKQFSRVKCMTAMNSKDAAGKSCSDIIGKCIANTVKRINNFKITPSNIKKITNPKTHMTGNACPKCGVQFDFKEGCKTCPSCGYSKCG